MGKKLSHHVKKAVNRGRTKLLRLRYGNPSDGARIIAVAGQSGKSTTRRLLTGLLIEAGHKVAYFDPAEHGHTLSSLWRELGDAKRKKAEFIIVEISPELFANDSLQALEIDTVIITNDCAEAEPLLRRGIEYAVIPDERQYNDLAIAEHQIVSYGKSEQADVRVKKVKLFRKGTEIQLLLDHHHTIDLATYLVGYANVSNVAAAVSAAYVLGVSLDTVADGISRCESIDGNFEYLSAGLFTMIFDTAQNERSAELVVQSAKELSKRRLVVALDISNASKTFIENLQNQADRLVVVKNAKNKLPTTVEVVETPTKAREVAERTAKKDDTVVLIGARFKE